MSEKKEFRFTEKKVDETWKEQTAREQGSFKGNEPESPTDKAPSSESEPQSKSTIFLNFLTSLGIQTMIHLGEIPNPETQKKELNLEAAREIIDLLLLLRSKTEGNRSLEETNFLNTIIPELQLKYSQKA